MQQVDTHVHNSTKISVEIEVHNSTKISVEIEVHNSTKIKCWDWSSQYH